MKITSATKLLGVIGHPIAHSLSPQMQMAAISAADLDYIYLAFHIRPDSLEDAISGFRAMGMAGVNVTIPHKERVIPFIDEISEQSRRINSVNTLVFKDDKVYGDTTDGRGFYQSCVDEWGAINDAEVLILGAGGSAKAVGFALADHNCQLTVANRTISRAEELADSINSTFGNNNARAVTIEYEELQEAAGRADLIVNTTSVGMHPDHGSTPLSRELIRPEHLVYDLVYNPVETRLVRESREAGAKSISGARMLVYQGAISFEMWTGIKPSVDAMEKAVISGLTENR